MKKRYYKILILSLALLALTTSAIYNEILAKDDSAVEISNSEKDVEIIVHISGQVKNEGLYNMKIGSRVGELIELSGGLRDDADMSNINLAEKLKDSQKIFIPLKKISSNQDEIETDNIESGTLTLEVFNILGQNQLEKLPGVGPVLAKNIYDYRNKNGAFMSIDDLINVSGIGEKKLITIKKCFK